MSGEAMRWERKLILGAKVRERIENQLSERSNRWARRWLQAPSGPFLGCVLHEMSNDAVTSWRDGSHTAYRLKDARGQFSLLWVRAQWLPVLVGVEMNTEGTEPSSASMAGSIVAGVEQRLLEALCAQWSGAMDEVCSWAIKRIEPETAELLSVDASVGAAVDRSCGRWVALMAPAGQQPVLAVVLTPEILEAWKLLPEPQTAAGARIVLTRRSEAIAPQVVGLRVVLGAVEMPFAEWAALEVGDVMLLDPGCDEAVSIETDRGVRVAGGSLGRVGGSRAVALTALNGHAFQNS